MVYRTRNAALKSLILLIIFCIACLSPSFAEVISDRYALILEDPPVVSRFVTREAARSDAAKNYHQQLEAKHQTLRDELASRNVRVTGSVKTLLNAIFVVAPKERVPELRALPGVIGVVPLRRYHRSLNRATGLVQAPAAWSALGGAQNAGSAKPPP